VKEVDITFTIEELKSLSDDELLEARSQTQEWKTLEEKLCHLKICTFIIEKASKNCSFKRKAFPFAESIFTI
jgi:hypothetical protein